jgi:hypothetical protein
MIIEFNTDKNIKGGDEHTAPFLDMIAESLSRFTDFISRIEVHLSDEDGAKEGQRTIRCLMEARMEGRRPIAVTAMENTEEQSVSSAIDKLIASLNSDIGRLRKH